MKGFARILGTTAAASVVGGGAWWMYSYSQSQGTVVNRDGTRVYKGQLTQRQRFDQFAGSTSGGPSDGDGSSQSKNNSKNANGGDAAAGEPTMTLEEFIASFLPEGTLPPTATSASSSKSRNRFASLEKIFNQLDANGDGVLSFSEYCALFCFIAADDDHFRTAFTMFDENDNGTLDAKEFDLLLKALNPDPSAKLLFNNSDAAAAGKHTRTNLLHTFFGPKLDKNLSFADFEKILRQLRSAVQEAEFEAVDYADRGELNATEFRRLMFAKQKESSLGVRQQQQQKKKKKATGVSSSSEDADEAAEWANNRREALRQIYREGDEHLTATKSTYLKFCEIIRCSDAILSAMNLYVDNKKRIAAGGGDGDDSDDDNNKSSADEGGATSAAEGLDKEEFLRACAIGVKGRVHLTPREMELFFAVFDGNHNGVIEPSEFKELCRINSGFGSGYYRDFSLPQLTRFQQFQLCMMQRDRR